jgi:hypothetical protein
MFFEWERLFNSIPIVFIEYYRNRIEQPFNDSYQNLMNITRWQEEIGIQEAYENLEKYFYRFREVIKYLPDLYSIFYSFML